jgi:hypothetical protein
MSPLFRAVDEAVKLLIQRRVVWFSCGAASAVAAKLAVDKHLLNVEVVHCDTLASEHPDNTRFLNEVSEWIKRPITTLKSKYSRVEEVFQARKYMSGVLGAPCTVEMKKKPRFSFQLPDDIHIFGLTKDEKKRADRFTKQNHELKLEWILVDHGITKDDCFDIVKDAGIELPKMYQLGFKNNNCIGCVKSQSPKYWNMVRDNFPEVFNERAKQSRELKCKLIKIGKTRIYLDELKPDNKFDLKEDLSCGPQCSSGI